MKLIAGLGNPGKEYAKTRHNSGFMVMDALASRNFVSLDKKKWHARVAKVNIHGEDVILAKPETYMNESGKAIAEIARFYDIEPGDILIIHDDMDLPTGSVRIRKNGSSGGQKGMRSIIQALGTSDIPRIRIGVGHSQKGNHDIVPDWVLSPIPKSEQPFFDKAIDNATLAAEAWLYEPFDLVMTKYNIREKKERED